MSVIQARTPIIMGEGVEFRLLDLPESLEGKTLEESAIGSRTGLIVLAINRNGELIASPPPDTVLEPGSKLSVLGTVPQIKSFKREFP